jgi:tetratricopeptide (TPR) repeat protein
MLSFRTTLACVLLAIGSTTTVSYAQDAGLLPKYGSSQKTEAQRVADQKFIKAIDDRYGGNRTSAAEELATRGWQLLRQGNSPDAMRRFNQAWLLDNSNGSALWGIAAVLGSTGNTAESLKLFSEAGRTIGGNLDFSVDFAKTLGIAGAQSNNDALLKDAFSRFQRNYEQAPQHVLNLQNWAVTLFYVGKHAEAWEKIQLAEAAPRRAELDTKFIAALQGKMPRP